MHESSVLPPYKHPLWIWIHYCMELVTWTGWFVQKAIRHLLRFKKDLRFKEDKLLGAHFSQEWPIKSPRSSHLDPFNWENELQCELTSVKHMCPSQTRTALCYGTMLRSSPHQLPMSYKIPPKIRHYSSKFQYSASVIHKYHGPGQSCIILGLCTCALKVLLWKL
jgi:hypothetical protein